MLYGHVQPTTEAPCDPLARSSVQEALCGLLYRKAGMQDGKMRKEILYADYVLRESARQVRLLVELGDTVGTVPKMLHASAGAFSGLHSPNRAVFPLTILGQLLFISCYQTLKQSLPGTRIRCHCLFTLSLARIT